MFCQNCGTLLEEGVKFCPNCGTQVVVPNVVETVAQAAEEPVKPVEETVKAAEEPVYAQPQAPVYAQPQAPVYEAPVVQPKQADSPLSKSILVFGILGVAFACTFYFSFLGIIFSAIAKGKVKKYVAEGYMLSGKSKVGNILATVGLILGIVLTVIAVLALVFGVILGLSNGGEVYHAC